MQVPKTLARCQQIVSYSEAGYRIRSVFWSVGCIGLNFFTNPGTEDFDCLYCLRGGGVGVCRKKVFKMEIWEIKVFKARIKGSLNR